MQLKKDTSLLQLATENDFSQEFLDIVQHVDSLGYEDCPDYDLIKMLFTKFLNKSYLGHNFQWKRQMAHNKYSMIKIISDEE